jgi:flotillin
VAAEVIVVVVIAVAVLLLLMWLVGSLFRRVGPNEALIVYGWGGTHIVTGGGKVVWPLFQSYQVLSLELMSFDVAPEQDLYTAQGVAVNVEAVAQIKVKSDPESIRTAAEQFLTKPQAEREALIRLVMEGHLRGIVGLLTVEQIVKEPEMVAGRVRQTVADDLSKMGLEVVSFTIKKVMDEQDYINNMGRPDVARIKREADIAQAQADQERVIAQTASEMRQAEAVRDLEVKKAEFEAAVRQQRALAEKAYDIAANQAQQRVVAEEVRIEQVRRQELIRVQELEVQRRERELEATVTKQAEAERRRIEILAEAQRQKLAQEAAGQAEAIRQQGLAEAEVVRAKGQAEADAMHLRAEAYQQYNQAAVLDKLLTAMPDVVRALSQALAGVDKVTIVATGDGRGGVSNLTGEVAKMIAQVPELFETLTGMKLGDLLGRLQGIRDGAGRSGVPDTAPARGITPSDPPDTAR